MVENYLGFIFQCDGMKTLFFFLVNLLRDFSLWLLSVGRIWAGHNILGFDCARIQEAFAHIGRPAPKPKGTIDSLTLLTQRFGRRAGNMKVFHFLSISHIITYMRVNVIR